MKIHSDAPSEEVQIQIIPLIDVIFCILTFFILAALQLTRQQGIDIDLPRASTGVTQTRDMLVVTISSTGQTFVDKQLVDRSQLAQLLQDYHQKNPDGLLVLNASKVAFYNDVVQVLDVMRSVGGDRVALATVPADSNPSPTASPSPNLDPYNLFGSPSSTGSPSPGSILTPAPSKPSASPATPLPNGSLNGATPAPLAPQISPPSSPQP